MRSVPDIDETIHLLAHTAPPIRSIDELDERARAVHVTRKTAGFERLPQQSLVRVLWASHVGAPELPLLCAADQLTHLAIYGCPFPDLRPLRQLTRLEALSLFLNTKASSLEGLGELHQIVLAGAPPRARPATLSLALRHDVDGDARGFARASRPAVTT